MHFFRILLSGEMLIGNDTVFGGTGTIRAVNGFCCVIYQPTSRC